MVVVVSVRHHPSHQGGHRVFNFTDHHRHRTLCQKIRTQNETRCDVALESRRGNNAQPAIISGSVYSSSVACDGFQAARRDVFPLVHAGESLRWLRTGCDQEEQEGISSQKAGLQWDVQPVVKISHSDKKKMTHTHSE